MSSVANPRKAFALGRGSRRYLSPHVQKDVSVMLDTMGAATSVFLLNGVAVCIMDATIK